MDTKEVLLQYRAGVRTIGTTTIARSVDPSTDCPDPDIEPNRKDATKRRTEPPRNRLKCHSIEMGVPERIALSGGCVLRHEWD